MKTYNPSSQRPMPNFTADQSRFGIVVIRLRALRTTDIRIGVVEMRSGSAVRGFWIHVRFGMMARRTHAVNRGMPAHATQMRTSACADRLALLVMRRWLQSRRRAVHGRMRSQRRTVRIATKGRECGRCCRRRRSRAWLWLL